MLNASVPTEDGGVFLSPAREGLSNALGAVDDGFSHMDFLVACMPGRALRDQARAELAEMLGVCPASPWIVAAHQSEMHHAGVWFKDVAAAALAGAAGGSALHVVADLDTVGKGPITVPLLSGGGRLRRVSASLASAGVGRCPAQLPPPTAGQLEELIGTFTGSLSTASMLDRWADAGRKALGQSRTLAEWVTASRAAVSESLGLKVHDVFWSRIAAGAAFARFAADLALRHREMYVAHGEVLSAHRSARGITNAAQPVPDLGRHEGAHELPLWVFRDGGPRERAFARDCDQGVELVTPAGPLARLPGEGQAATETIISLMQTGVILAPRALTLTLFLRTFLADLFVHGVGGTRYEAVAEALTRRWFSFQPPPLVTASATLRLPLPREPATQADLARARWHVHHAWHNPQLYVEGEKCPPQAAGLLRRKGELLEAMTSGRRFSQERSEAFAELHRVNDELRRLLPEGQSATKGRLEEVGRGLAHNALADSREVFFVLMPPGKLTGLIDRARRWSSSVG